MAKREKEEPKKVKKKSKAVEAAKSVKKKKRAEKEIIDVDEPRKKSKKKSKDAAKEELQAKSFMDYDAIQGAVEKKYDLSSAQLAADPRDRLSTGLMVQDLVLSGGILGGGWYTWFGKEQCAKSTNCTQIMTAALNTDVPIIQYYDYEGSSEPNYIESVMKSMGVKGNLDKVFGVQDEEGHYVVKPRVRFYQPDDAETFFNSLAKLLRSLPQIKTIGGTQYYAFPDEKHFHKIVGDKYDKKLKQKTGLLCIPTEHHVHHQALIIVDSYPAMLPEKLDVDDQGSGMAAQARMFSENIKKVKSKMKSRRVTVIGVNQLRLAPAVMFGNPEYEPCGEALKLFSDVRMKNTSRSIPHGKGQLEEEKSVNGEGNDIYRYVHCRAIKNKLGAPNLEGWMRIWVSDNEGKGRGFCPVWDTYEYGKMTGQIYGPRNKLTVVLPNGKTFKKVTWMQFKTLIIGDKDQKIKTLKHIGSKEYYDVRGQYKKQCAAGQGLKLFFKTKAEGAKEEKDDE